jgi:AcrR family transcriptional regulator
VLVARRRARDAEASREAILGAAQEVFGRRGFHGASVEEIAAAAGVGKGTVFLHFKNKENLLFKLLEHRFAAVERLYSEVARPEMTALQQLEELAAVDHWLKREVRDINRAVVSMWAGLSPGLKARIGALLSANYDLYRKRVAGLFRQVLGAGSFDGVPVDAIAAAFLASFDGLISRERVSPGLKPSAAAVGRALRYLFIDNLARRGPGAPGGEGRS